QSGRLFLVLGRAAWLPQGRQHSALPRCGTRLLCDRSLPDRAHVLTRASIVARPLHVTLDRGPQFDGQIAAVNAGGSRLIAGGMLRVGVERCAGAGRRLHRDSRRRADNWPEVSLEPALLLRVLVVLGALVHPAKLTERYVLVISAPRALFATGVP